MPDLCRNRGVKRSNVQGSFFGESVSLSESCFFSWQLIRLNHKKDIPVTVWPPEAPRTGTNQPDSYIADTVRPKIIMDRFISDLLVTKNEGEYPHEMLSPEHR